MLDARHGPPHDTGAESPWAAKTASSLMRYLRPAPASALPAHQVHARNAAAVCLIGWGERGDGVK